MTEASDKAAAARAARAEKESAEQAEPEATAEEAPPQVDESVPKDVVAETHTVESVIAASQALFGVSSEVMAGAVAEAGWEMTKQVRLDEAQVALEQFLQLPV